MFVKNLLTAATNVGVLYVMVAAGFICDRVKVFTEATARKTIDLLLYVIVPCTLVNSFLSMERSEETVRKFFLSFAVALATHIIGIVINIPFFRNRSNEDNPVYKFSAIYGNVGFMALPLAQAVLGDEGVFYCASGVVVFNIINFTHGVALMQKTKEKLSLKKLIINPGVISMAIGLPIFLLGLKVPYVLSKPVEMLAALNSPVAMLIFGTYLSKTDLKSMFTDGKIYFVGLMKLIILPLVCMAAYHLCGVSGTLLTASIITASVPSANNTFMFASKYGRDASLASKTVALVSFLSVLTMPVMIALTQQIG